MMIEPIGILALLLGLISLAASPSFALYCLFAAALLQSAAAITITSLGNANVQPAHLLLVFVCASLLRHARVRSGMLVEARPPRPGFWLVSLLIYAVISAALLPRLFLGATYTFSNARIAGAAGGPQLVPLEPNSGNITQTGYFAGDVVCFLLLAAFANRRRNRFALTHAVLFCCAANLLFAVLDQLTYLTNTVELLSPIRNSSYRMLDDAESLGVKRLVGSFPEASAFAFTTLGLFGFCFSLWLRGYRTRLTGLLAVCLLSALILSTSSTAYAGLIIYLVLVYGGAAIRMSMGTATRNMSLLLLLGPVVALLFLMGIAFSDSAARIAWDTIDGFLLGKLNTASGIERAQWNRQAIANFFDTFGLGAGLGSVRSSSFLTSALGNVGIVGLLMFAGFFVSLVVRAKLRAEEVDPDAANLQQAAASACLAYLIAASISGGSIDLGLLFFALAALASSSIAAEPIAMPILDGIAHYAPASRQALHALSVRDDPAFKLQSCPPAASPG